MLSIVFTIICLAAIIVFAIQAYKTAVSTERNAALWIATTVLTGFIFQYIIPFVIGFAIAVYYVRTEGDLRNLNRDFGGFLMMVEIVSLVLSLWGMGMVVKFISRVKEDEPVGQAPPPPPTFNGGE